MLALPTRVVETVRHDLVRPPVSRLAGGARDARGGLPRRRGRGPLRSPGRPRRHVVAGGRAGGLAGLPGTPPLVDGPRRRHRRVQRPGQRHRRSRPARLVVVRRRERGRGGRRGGHPARRCPAPPAPGEPGRLHQARTRGAGRRRDDRDRCRPHGPRGRPGHLPGHLAVGLRLARGIHVRPGPGGAGLVGDSRGPVAGLAGAAPGRARGPGPRPRRRHGAGLRADPDPPGHLPAAPGAGLGGTALRRPHRGVAARRPQRGHDVPHRPRLRPLRDESRPSAGSTRWPPACSPRVTCSVPG